MSKNNLNEEKKPGLPTIIKGWKKLFIWSFQFLLSIFLSIVYLYIVTNIVFSTWGKNHPTIIPQNDAPDMESFVMAVLIVAIVSLIALPVLAFFFYLIKKTPRFFERN